MAGGLHGPKVVFAGGWGYGERVYGAGKSLADVWVSAASQRNGGAAWNLLTAAAAWATPGRRDFGFVAFGNEVLVIGGSRTFGPGACGSGYKVVSPSDMQGADEEQTGSVTNLEDCVALCDAYIAAGFEDASLVVWDAGGCACSLRRG